MWKLLGIFLSSGFWWRLLLVGVVAVLGLGSLWAGDVSFSARPRPYDLATTIYYTFGLFVYGGLDLGVPVGKEPWARVLLWTAYFLAPAITTTALIEALLWVTRPDAWRLFLLRNHVVVGGCGRLALVFLERLQNDKRDRKRPVLVVERRADNPHLRMVSQRPRTRVLIGDISSAAVLKTLKLERAKKVKLLTGDDSVNLDAALRIQKIWEQRPKELWARVARIPVLRRLEKLRDQRPLEIWAHVANIRLLRRLDKGSYIDPINLFNGYRTAARHLVKTTLLPHFNDTPKLLNAVVLAGFGRFGQTVLNQLQQGDAAGRFKTVIIIDREAKHLAAVFREEVGFNKSYRCKRLQADLRNPRTWQKVWRRIGDPDPPPVFVLACGTDAINIHAALSLSEKYPEAKIVVRCFRSSSFTELIAKKCGVEIVSPGDLLLNSTREELLAET